MEIRENYEKSIYGDIFMKESHSTRKTMRKITRKICLLLFLTLFGITSTLVVDAYIPVTYACCYDYSLSNGSLLNGFEDTSNSGIQLDGFENLSNWTVGGTGAAQQADTVNYIEGSQALKLIATNGNKAYTDKVINNNFSTTNNFVVWMYVYDSSTTYYVTMYLTSNGSANGSWKTYFADTLSDFHQGWNKLIFNKGDFVQGSSSINESWNNTMNTIRLSVKPFANVSTNVSFDNLKYNMTNDWMISGSGSFVQPDTSNFMEGQQGLKLVNTNGTGSMDLSINNNFSNTNNFDFWAYIDNASNASGMTLYLTSNGSKWNTYFYYSEWSEFKTGWNHLVFSKHNLKNIGGENWNNVMNRIRLRTWPHGNYLNTTFDYLTFDMSGKRAKIMFNFDDGTIDQYQKAFPILSANNQTAVDYVVTSHTTWNGYLNVSELKAMQSGGWDISSHTVDHPDLRTLNDSALTSELNDSYAWLVASGFQKSAGFLAYPYGDFNDNVINKAQQRYIFARDGGDSEASQQFTTTSDNTIQYIGKYIITSNVSVPDILDQINDSINSKLLSIVTFHVINDTNPTNDPYTTLTSDLQSVSNYVKSRSADADVMTYSDDYVIPQINPFTPVVNKTTRLYSNGSSVLLTRNKYDEYMSNTTIIPSSDSVDINMVSYDEMGGSIKFNESNSNSPQILYNIGDRTPNWLYLVNVSWSNGSVYQNFALYANSTGYINYTLPGVKDSRVQDIEPTPIDTSFTVTLPIGYTALQFNSPNSTINNLNAVGQTDTQSFYDITNNGNINQSYVFYLDSSPPNINTYADLTNNFTNRILIKPSISTQIIPNLGPGSSQNIWMVIDANQAPPTNMNAGLTINTVSPQIPGWVSNDCDPTLWNHVWGENQNLTYRLLSNTTYSCVKVSGIVEGYLSEEDGDYHIAFHLDPQYYSFAQDIQLEMVCSSPYRVNQSVCNNDYNLNLSYLFNNISILSHIVVTGAYVIDMPQSNISINQISPEIHPVTSIGPVILNEIVNSTYKNLGDTIQYKYIIKNTGNDILNGFSITDNKTGIIPCPGNLYPGQSIQCTSNYVISQNDINNGSVTNSAYISIVSNGIIINSNLVTATVHKSKG
jgi:peptidoglycan/xylan/chitin deacetylase (PgdA/CDA1 family)